MFSLIIFECFYVVTVVFCYVYCIFYECLMMSVCV